VISEDAVARGYASNSRHEHSQFESYLAHIQLTAEERADSNLVAVWGRPDIEGRMLCQKYGIKLHVIEKLNADSQELTGCQLVGSSGSVAVEEHSSLYSEPQMIHILNEGQCHFVPVLRNTSVCSKPKKKRSHSSLLEGVQSQDNPMDGSALHLVKSVAASPQQVSLLSAQPGHLEQGEEKTKSASEGKTYQAVGDPYLKECSLNDNNTCRAVAKKEDADFKILMITNSPTVSAALDFMKQAGFYETFNQASHWFFIVVRVDDCNESPSHAVEYLAAVFDTEKPVIIQWDFMCSAEHLVFFRQANQHAFTQLQMNSDSLLTTENELIAQLSKKGSFQLPLLLNALMLSIGGQFKGDASDLLGVSFDVKQEINDWRLIDYAARDDDSLSLQFLLLADWDLAYRNGRGRRTLEIAAEYAGPQSLAALLNLPITSSAEELFLTDAKKGLLALTDGDGDTPLLIAAQNGRPETLQYLIWCGADMHCHRPGNENVTAIALAWDKEHYENVQVLLEADSPFPENFDLSVLEGSENITALMKQVEARQSFHQAIKEGSQHGVKAFIKRHPRLKWAYDPSNKSALLTALEAGQYEIYALLQSEGFPAGKNEDLSVVIQELTSEQKQRLTEAQLKYFGKQGSSHIIYLLSKSRLGFGQDRKNFESIQGLYEQLDAIPEISTILKVVEQSEKIEIIFDFNRDSIIDLDPTQSSNTSGACDYRAGCIYVGAKDQTKLPGTLAHELTHLAMQVCYNNCCNPYEVLDEQRKRAFGKIVEQYCDKTGGSHYSTCIRSLLSVCLACRTDCSCASFNGTL
jgi:ankyrin repeat protein